jgi:uncharacterized protein YbcC (UPF0753/DUF2309 family)
MSLKPLRNIILQIAAEGYEKKIIVNDDVFKKDVFLFFIVRKMVRRFLQKGVINEKLLLNNIIICLNNFGITRTNNIFRLMTEEAEFGVLKACLIFLNSYSIYDSTRQNQIMKDILDDVTHRYHLHPKEEN